MDNKKAMAVDMSSFVVDIEVSSYCNANCYFCPRSSVPFLKNIEQSVFEKVLDQIEKLSFRPRVIFCGTGDASVHPDIIHLVRMSTLRGHEVELVTNGILVDRVFSEKIIDAGLKKINFSIAETGRSYDAIYDFSFEKIVMNVMDFNAISQGRCEITINLIKELTSKRRLDIARKFWKSRGINNLLVLTYTNRAGLLSLGKVHLDSGSLLENYRQYGIKGICDVPFKFIHIGADGTYYLCSHDFSRRVAFGNVSTHTIPESLALKLAYFEGKTEFCQSCTNYIANKALKKINEGYDNIQARTLILDIETEIIKLVEDSNAV